MVEADSTPKLLILYHVIYHDLYHLNLTTARKWPKNITYDWLAVTYVTVFLENVK